MAQTAQNLSHKNNNQEVIKLAAKQWADLLITHLNHRIAANNKNKKTYANTKR